MTFKEQIAARLLQFLSESEVKEFAVGEGYFQDEDEEEEEKEELTSLNSRPRAARASAG
jgi:hypothetical protein